MNYIYKFYTRLGKDSRWFFYNYYSSRSYGLNVIKKQLLIHPCISSIHVMVERYAFGCKDDSYCKYFDLEI